MLLFHTIQEHRNRELSRQQGRVRIWCAMILLCGLIVRLGLVLTRPPEDFGHPEPVAIALSLAKTGHYADAYGPGVGPTAHSAPLHPLLLSVIFRVWGDGIAGNLTIRILASVAAAMAFAMLPALGVACRLGLGTGVVAGFAGALLPINFWAQTGGTFDAPFTATALIGLCLLICRIWRNATFSLGEGVIFGVAAGLACLVNFGLIPILIAGALVSLAIFKLQMRSVTVFIGTCALYLLVVLSPWAIRNHKALGAWIWTRSNLGLELYVSNNDIVTADQETNVRMPEFLLLHPFVSESERAKVRQLGEVAYSQGKMQEALGWIESHKRRFLTLTVERFWLFWFPRMLRMWQSVLESALTLLAFGGLILLVRSHSRAAWLFISILVAYPVIYYFLQETSRYRFPIEPILFLLAAVPISHIAEHYRSKYSRASLLM